MPTVITASGTVPMGLAVAVSSVLDAFGVGPDAERLYRHVLRLDGLDGQDLDLHAAALGWSGKCARLALQPLVKARLVRVDPDGALVADHPRTAIGRLVDQGTASLDLRRRELDGARAAVSDFAAEHRAGRAGADTRTAFEVLPAHEEVAAVQELLRSTKGLLRVVHLDVASGPVTGPRVHPLAREQVTAGRELRSIYPAAILDDPALLKWVGDWAAVGEQQRVTQVVFHEYVVFGDEAILAAPHWGSADGGTVLIRLPLVVHAFTQLFEDAWAGGLPVPDRKDERDVGARLLALLAAGLKDEAIARHLGIGVRTVRRRVAEVMDELGAQTRFQLGAAAERRSLLGRD